MYTVISIIIVITINFYSATLWPPKVGQNVHLIRLIIDEYEIRILIVITDHQSLINEQWKWSKSLSYNACLVCFYRQCCVYFIGISHLLFLLFWNAILTCSQNFPSIESLVYNSWIVIGTILLYDLMKMNFDYKFAECWKFWVIKQQ